MQTLRPQIGHHAGIEGDGKADARVGIIGIEPIGGDLRQVNPGLGIEPALGDCGRCRQPAMKSASLTLPPMAAMAL